MDYFTDALTVFMDLGTKYLKVKENLKEAAIIFLAVYAIYTKCTIYVTETDVLRVSFVVLNTSITHW